MNIVFINEHEVDIGLQKQIELLLQECFVGYPTGQSCLYQLPSFRFLAKEKRSIIGHAAIDNRVVNVNGRIINIWGISDFCVEKTQRKKGIGQELLKSISQKALDCSIDFIMLLSDDSDFYKKQKFKRKNVRARWVMIHDERLFGIQERTMNDTIYVLELTENKWPKGAVDFLGTLF